MNRIRRAFLMALLEQHLGIVVNFALIAIVSRLLSPADVGLAVIGLGITTVVFALREFASSDFLIQLEDVSPDDLSTSLTVLVAISIALGAFLYLASAAASLFYGQPQLQQYLSLSILAAIAETAGLPAFSMMRRDLAFGHIARVRTIGLVCAALVTIVAASQGWGFLSFAFGFLAGNLVSTALAALAHPAIWLSRPCLRSLHRIVEFGRYKGAASVVDKIYEALPQLVLGHTMTSAAVGIYSRANTVCSIPDRILLSAVFSIAFPALAAEVREGRDVKGTYVQALSYITVLYWPALLMVAILAGPIVRVMLGEQWAEVVPIAAIMAVAVVFWFPVVLTTPLLIALGANRDAFVCNVVSRSASAVILCVASLFGLTVMAFSLFLTLPLQMLVSFHFVRRHVHFSWRQLLVALAPSAIVTLATIGGPLLMAAWLDFKFEFTLAEALLASVLAMAGWAVAVIGIGHPFLGELRAVLLGLSTRRQPPAAQTDADAAPLTPESAR